LLLSCPQDLTASRAIARGLCADLIPQRRLNSLTQFRWRLVVRGSTSDRANDRALRCIRMLAVTAIPQVPLDFLVSNGIQFAIQITIHQIYSFFAVHFISPY
jgi:hypothetical protein